MRAEPNGKPSSTLKKADQYNDPKFNYLNYWNGREYEHAAEELAIRRLLKGKHFGKAIDVGGGYGRLCLLLEEYADKVILTEPSQQQLDIAKEFLRDHPDIDRRLMQADNLQFADESIDLVTMIRVMHHLPDPTQEFNEIARILSNDGYAIIEVANYAHAINRFKHILKGRKLPVKPVDIRSSSHKNREEIPFVNHNPYTVMRQLAHAGLRIEKILSVSNLRNPRLKKALPLKMMLAIEEVLQVPLAPSFFGPSVFFFVKKSRQLQ